jgi:hypothetical protein
MFVHNAHPDFYYIDNFKVELISAPSSLPGDYNGDGTVGAADYAVWRDGSSPDDTQAGYDLWKANFGNSGAGGGAAVPEPAYLQLAVLLLLAALLAYRRGNAELA